MKLNWIVMTLALCSAGCTIGNGHICGPQTPRAYCDREAYEELMHPKPLIKKWEKPGMTEETRNQDSNDCGGGSDARRTPASPGFSPEKIKAEQRPGEEELVAFFRLKDKWERCMLNKGYRYTGECSSRPSPACGAP